jgi:cyclic pyranopterin phosphate synthase
MPREIYDHHEYLPRSEILDYDEIARVARIGAGLGVTKIRLTGGEPLLRKELATLVSMLSDIDGIEDLALTTNGQLLAAQAQALAEAGLSRITVSLDGLDDAVVKRLIDTDVPVATVLEAIAAASGVGLGPIKINTVVRRSWNEDQVIPLVDYFRGSGHTVRFIEYMDVGTSNNWQSDEVVTSAELMGLIASRWPLRPVDPAYRGEVASQYEFVDGAGTVGFISSVSEPFCGDCTRLRLSADGSLYTCLFASSGTDIKQVLRSDAPDEEVRQILESLWGGREDRYSELRGGVPLPMPRVEMSYIGG